MLTEVKDRSASEPTTVQRPAGQEQEHLPVIDGLRAIAFLLVFGCHAFHNQTGHGPIFDTIFSALNHGWAGVDLFFVISGFLITGILLDTRQSANYFRSFYARRFLRIVPLCYGYCFVGLFLVPLLVPATNTAQLISMRQDQFWVWSFLTNVLIELKHTYAIALFGHFWSLAIEEHFYIFWPLLVFFVSPKRLGKVCIALIAGTFILRCGWMFFTHDSLGANVLTPLRLDALAVGALCAIAWQKLPRSDLSILSKRCLFAMSSIILLTFTFSRWELRTDFTPTFGFTLLACFFGSLLLALVTSNSLSLVHRILLHPSMRFVGKYSYGLYILHLSMLKLASVLGIAAAVTSLTHSPTLGVLAWSAVALSFTIIAAFLSWHLWEKHFLALKRFFPRT